MLKRERTNELNELQEKILESIKEHMAVSDYYYKYNLILHSFSNEFLLKLYIYPSYGQTKNLSLLCTIYLSKEKELIKMKNMMNNEFIQIEDNSFEYMSNLIENIMDDYHSRIRISNYKK